jgi:rSAM/selenodomain-associated transferase 2
MSIAPLKTSTISVIIPTLNEADHLTATLAPLRREPNLEIIVADGGSSDASAGIAQNLGAMVVRSEPGRARQQNRGAAAASGEILLFLHADTVLPAGFGCAVRSCLASSQVVAGAFRLTIAGANRSLRLIETLANWRAGQLQMPYGDQTLFLRRSTFIRLGGFPEQEIMEDFELVRRLKKLGRIDLLELAASTSDRRWRALGTVRTTLINQAIILGYLLGCSPYSLASWYRRSSRARR